MNAPSLIGLAWVNVLFLLAGLGLSVALGDPERGTLALRPALAYLAGTAATALLVAETAIVGLRAGASVVSACGLLIATGGVAVGARRGVVLRRPRFEPNAPAGPFPGIALLCAAAAGVVLVAFLDASWDRGVANFDAWTFWEPKALVLHYFGADVVLLRDVIASKYEPLWVPSYHASALAFAGGNTMVASIQCALLLGGFALGLVSLLRRVAPPLYAWLPVLGLLVLPHVIRRGLAPEADLPWQELYAAGIVALALWAQQRRRELLPLAALFLAAAANAKREGAYAAVLAIVCAPLLARQELLRQRRAALGAALFVVASATPWWVWVELEEHRVAGLETLAASLGGIGVAVLLAWAPRARRRLLVLLAPVAVAVVGAGAYRVLRSAGTTHLERIHNAIPVATWDLFDPTLWLLAPPASLLVLLLALRRGDRLARFVLALSTALYLVYVARLLQIYPSWMTKRNLVPTARNMGSIVFLWLAVTPLLVRDLLPAVVWRPPRLALPAAVAALPAALVLAIAVGEGHFAFPSGLCAAPVTNPADAAFVFGHRRTEAAATTLQKQVEHFGFAGTEVALDPCGDYRVLTPHLTVQAARSQRMEARSVGIAGTIEQTNNR